MSQPIKVPAEDVDVLASSREAGLAFAGRLDRFGALVDHVKYARAPSAVEVIEEAIQLLHETLDDSRVRLSAVYRFRLRLQVVQWLLVIGRLEPARAELMAVFADGEMLPPGIESARQLARAQASLAALLVAEGRTEEARVLWALTARAEYVELVGEGSGSQVALDLALGFWREGLKTIANGARDPDVTANQTQLRWCADLKIAADKLAVGVDSLLVVPSGFARPGFGDVLWHLQLSPLLTAKAKMVRWLVPAPLFELAATRLPVGQTALAIDPGTDPASLISGDLVLLDQTLPHLLGVDLDGRPLPPAFARSRPAARKRTQLRIGFSWSGSPRTRHDARRSTRLHDWLPLLRRSDCSWVSIQTGHTPEDAALLETLESVERIPSSGDFESTARIVEHCDLVIAVDSSPAHLAGILGVPVWLLLPPGLDGRWGPPGRTGTIWYMNHRLWWKSADWEELFDRVGAELDRLVQLRRAEVA